MFIIYFLVLVFGTGVLWSSFQGPFYDSGSVWGLYMFPTVCVLLIYLAFFWAVVQDGDFKQDEEHYDALEERERLCRHLHLTPLSDKERAWMTVHEKRRKRRLVWGAVGFVLLIALFIYNILHPMANIAPKGF